MRRSPLWLAGILAGGILSSVAFSVQAETIEEGGKLYNNTTCVACHGKDGKGKLPGVPDFTKKGGRLTKTDDVLASNIMNGFKSPGSSMAMPAKGGVSSLTQEQAEAIVSYMRQAFAGN
ncbi:cytochrome c [Marinobacter sp.]|uniref:c-type cytochrome n=1 Tax=Marinobacter sp. TaxID=50741 RepID=UPI001B788128|nr:cytochrome c [Marinobacter sp.]MBQ0831875.1 cytochrome c [Marinobacter sp.]